MDHLILLADDSEKLRRSVADILQDEGYSVVEAATGNQALAQLRSARQQFDLLITDLSMPEMDGLQILTEIKPPIQVFPSLQCRAHSAVAC